MSEQNSEQNGQSLTAAFRLDRVCNAFEETWKQGCPGCLEDQLEGVSAAERPALLRELILIELYHRQKRGELCAAEDYLARFPELDRDWLLKALAGAEPDGQETQDFVFAATEDKEPVGEANTRASGQNESNNPADFEILGEIGRGGMGVVYKARQRSLRRIVALKKIEAGQRSNAAALTRFRIEAEAAARLEHEGIVRIHHVGQEGEQPYLIMEYVEGGSLKDQLDGTPWPGRKAATLVQQLARILHAAHKQGVIHRDVKPANILRTPTGQVKLTDFGLAKLMDAEHQQTQTGEILGTLSYMAPEQARGQSKAAGVTADVYSLGAILYELLTGRPPFRGATSADTLLQVLGDTPAPPRLLNSRIDRDLETICLQCLEKDPNLRYPSAEALAEDLARYSEGRPIQARSPGWLDAVVRGLNYREMVAKKTWGIITLSCGLVAGIGHAIINWLIVTEQAKEWFWLGLGLILLLVISIIWRGLNPRRYSLTRAERQILSLWVGYFFCTTAFWVALGMPYDATLSLIYYPSVAAITGLVYWAHGSLFWGRFYLVSLLFFVLAWLMHFTPMLAPLEFGLAFAACSGVIGWNLLRAREEE